MADRSTQSPLNVAQHYPVTVFPLQQFLCWKFRYFILRNKALVYVYLHTLSRVLISKIRPRKQFFRKCFVVLLISQYSNGYIIYTKHKPGSLPTRQSTISPFQPTPVFLLLPLRSTAKHIDIYPCSFTFVAKRAKIWIKCFTIFTSLWTMSERIPNCGSQILRSLIVMAAL